MPISVPRPSVLHLLVLATACVMPSVSARALAADAVRPNVVLIFADDLGWQDTGFSGSDFSETPNLDRLAREGMVFRQAYSSAGNCQPSRACLVSGQYTPRHHVYAVGSTNRGPGKLMRMVPVPNAQALPKTTVTLGAAMKSAGYATGMFGKTHLSKGPKGTKSEHDGFDVVRVSQHGLNSKDPDDPKGSYSITSAACEFIEASRSKPFFAYIAHYAVHAKLQATSPTLRHFKDKKPGELHGDALMAACTAELDKGVGMIVDKLDELGLSDRTLVVFTSDNGGTHWSQEPLRGKKGGYYEGGIRVPTLARWPGVVEPGSTCDVPVLNVDLYPTFLEVAGGEPSRDHVLDGESLVPLLRGKPALERDAIFWHFPGYLDGPVPRGRDPVFRTRPVSVIRKGDWKLHLYHEEWQLDGGRATLATNDAVELYNLRDDPGERTNVALTEIEERDDLLDDLLSWQESTGALLPTEENPAYESKASSGSTPDKVP